MKLKMWIGNLDGLREGLVIAATKVRARAIVGSTRGDFEAYWREHPVDLRLKPDVLYTRRFGAAMETWYPLASVTSERGAITRHVAYVEMDLESFRRGGSTRTAMCVCGWRGPERGTLELAVDDALVHEQSDFAVQQKEP